MGGGANYQQNPRLKIACLPKSRIINITSFVFFPLSLPRTHWNPRTSSKTGFHRIGRVLCRTAVLYQGCNGKDRQGWELKFFCEEKIRSINDAAFRFICAACYCLPTVAEARFCILPVTTIRTQELHQTTAFQNDWSLSHSPIWWEIYPLICEKSSEKRHI